ncbi:hypothetical protein Dimus_028346 [Dionaea muscipula]
MTFEWIKIRTTALQPISADVTLLNNETSSRIQVTEESVFNPEQWVQGLGTGLPAAPVIRDLQRWGEMDHTSSSHWSHVSDSCLSKGPNSAVIPAIVAECPLTAVSGSKGLEACEGFETEAVDGIANFKNALVQSPMFQRNTPFISSVRLTPDRCQLVVDLGRTFGPIPLLQEKRGVGKDTGHNNLALANDAHASNHSSSDSRPAPHVSGLMQAVSTLPATSQQIITKLGERGRFMDAPTTVPSCSSVRSGKGVSLRKKRSGIAVKAAREAVFKGTTPDTIQKDLPLLQEATTAWELGKLLGL